MHKLALEDAKWREGKLYAERAIAEHRARQTALHARRDALAPPRDVTALKKAIARAERDGQLEERRDRNRAERARLEGRARSELSALGLGSRSWTEIMALPVPSPETMERFAEQLATHTHEARQLGERKASVTARLVALQRDLDVLQRGGHVPSEQDLVEARQARDAHWKGLRKKLVPGTRGKSGGNEPGRSDVATYEATVRAADEMADRLRREAERVSRLAASAPTSPQTKERGPGRGETEIAAQAAATAGVRRLWQPLGLTPRSPLEMKAWLLKHASFLRAGDALRQADADLEELDRAVEHHRHRLLGLLAQLDPSPGRSLPAERENTALPLAELLDRASRSRRPSNPQGSNGAVRS